MEEKVLTLEKDLRKANDKVSNLEGILAQAKATITSTRVKLTQTMNKLHKSEEDKILLTQRLKVANMEIQDQHFKFEEEKICLMQQLHEHSTKIRL